MEYQDTVRLKDGRTCVLRAASGEDAEAVCGNFSLTHAQTDFLLSYPEENSYDADRERQFLTDKKNSADEVELCAVVDGRIVGTAGLESLGKKDKVRHRAEFGISIEREYWGLGIGRALLAACIECAKRAGYAQLELDVVGENARAIRLYQSMGFTEYGRNPRGFRSRNTGWQELVLMRLELSE